MNEMACCSEQALGFEVHQIQSKRLHDVHNTCDLMVLILIELGLENSPVLTA